MCYVQFTSHASRESPIDGKGLGKAESPVPAGRARVILTHSTSSGRAIFAGGPCTSRPGQVRAQRALAVFCKLSQCRTSPGTLLA